MRDDIGRLTLLYRERVFERPDRLEQVVDPLRLELGDIPQVEDIIRDAPDGFVEEVTDDREVCCCWQHDLASALRFLAPRMQPEGNRERR